MTTTVIMTAITTTTTEDLRLMRESLCRPGKGLVLIPIFYPGLTSGAIFGAVAARLGPRSAA